MNDKANVVRIADTAPLDLDPSLVRAVNAFAELCDEDDPIKSMHQCIGIKAIQLGHARRWRPAWKKRPLPDGAGAELRVQDILRAIRKAAEAVMIRRIQGEKG